MATIHESAAKRRRRVAADFWACVACQSLVTSAAGLLSVMTRFPDIDTFAGRHRIGRPTRPTSPFILRTSECVHTQRGTRRCGDGSVLLHLRRKLDAPLEAVWLRGKQVAGL